MKWLFCILCLMVQTGLLAQSEFLLKGRAVDSETGQPLSFASVVYPQKKLGTATDASGYFKFYLPSASAKEYIEISFVGYQKLRIVIGEFENDKTYALAQDTRELDAVSVIAKPEKFKLKTFMRKAIKDFNSSKNGDSHIAYTHYREGATKDGKPIMYIESIGYSIFLSNKGWAPYANYKFISEETRAYADHPAWTTYGINVSGKPANGVHSSGSTILRAYRVLENKGLFSSGNFKKYSFSRCHE